MSEVVWTSVKVTDAVAWPEALKLSELLPAPQDPAAGYEGAVPFGLVDGPEKVTQSVAETYPLAALS